MTDLERLARVLCIADGLDPDEDPRLSREPNGPTAEVAMLNPVRWTLYTRKVRALLQELREPSEGMINEAISEYVGDVDAENVWQAMIDSILTEGA